MHIAKTLAMKARMAIIAEMLRACPSWANGNRGQSDPAHDLEIGLGDLHAIDLYCGCGGLSLGGHGAGLTTALAVDIDQNLTSSFSANFPGIQLVNGDLLTLDPNDLKSRYEIAKPTAVIGGPPCQGFSVIGRRDADDPRNGLLRRYFEYVAAFEPSFFFMENVPGLLDPKNRATLDSALELISARYRVLDPVVLDAADFGAATSRPRLVVIGYDPSEMDPFGMADIEAAKTATRATVKDAIADLPNPRRNGRGWSTYRADVSPSDYAQGLRRMPKSGLGQEAALNKLEESVVSGFLPTHHTEAVVKRFHELKPGKRDPISKYPKLKWDAPAHVLRAGTGSDKGSYQAARPVHPDEPRVITVREAARIQGFPDWFQFHPTKWHSHRMIGNSVSPPFAQAILEVIVSKLERASVPQAAE